MNYNQFNCSVCFKTPEHNKLQRHKIIPSGTLMKSNIIITCRKCHKRIVNQNRMEERRGRIGEITYQDIIDTVKELMK
jgi:hypothetical protein